MSCFVLVPGGGGDPWYWHRLVPELQRRGHDAVPVALPVGDDAAGLERYADAVVDAVGDRRDLVVVGHSMGGLTAPLVCSRLPVRLLVLLAAMVPRHGETGGQWWSATGHTGPGLDDRELYFHDVPADLAEVALAREDVQSSRPFEDPWPLASWPDVPTRVVAGRDDRLFSLDFQRRIARERLGLEVDEVPGGHLCMLSQPVALADVLARLLASV